LLQMFFLLPKKDSHDFGYQEGDYSTYDGGLSR